MPFNADDRALFIGCIPQTNYATATAAAAGPPKSYIEEVVVDESFGKLEPKVQNNQGHSTGVRFPTESWTEAWDSTFGYTVELSAQNAGRYFHAGLGTTTSTTAGGKTTHVHKPLDTAAAGLQMPPYSLVEQLAPSAGGINKLWPSMLCEELDIEANGTGRLRAKVSWRGSGEETDPSGVTNPTHVTGVQGTQYYFFNTMAKLNFGADSTASAEDITCDYESFKLNIKNEYMNDAGYRPGCPRYFNSSKKELGVIRSELLLKDSVYTPEFTLRLRANQPEHLRLRRREAFSLAIILTGDDIAGSSPAAAFSLRFDFPITKFQMVEKTVSDKLVMVTVKPEILYSKSASQIVVVTLVNNVTSYTT